MYDLIESNGIQTDPAAIASAELVKARVQAAYLMAIQRPRNEEGAKAIILNTCKNPYFAKKAIYKKPVGDTTIEDLNIRFAEVALRAWKNVSSDIQTIYEDDMVRRIKVQVIDLEANTAYNKEIQIKKTVERKYAKGREVVGERLNKAGEKIFIVIATDDELQNKENALISKIIRNEGLRLIPEHIKDEARNTIRETLKSDFNKNPRERINKMIQTFNDLGVQNDDLKKVLGHSPKNCTADEMTDLLSIYNAIKDGGKISDYYKQKEKAPKKQKPKTIEEEADKFATQTHADKTAEEKYPDIIPERFMEGGVPDEIRAEIAALTQMIKNAPAEVRHDAMKECELESIPKSIDGLTILLETINKILKELNANKKAKGTR